MTNPFNLQSLHMLYAQHSRDAITLAFLLTRDKALAEDIVQDAFVKVARRLADLRHPEAFPAYLRTTVINLVRSHTRRQSLHWRSLERLETVDRVEASTTGEEGRLWTALATLPFRQRAALVLRFCNDLSEREVAELLGTSEKAVRSLVERGKKALQAELGGSEAWTL